MDADSIPRLLKVTTRSDQVLDALREAILSGRLKPGDMLVERKLAESFGVSKTPVREALIALAARGLVTANRNYGVTVRQLSPLDVQKVYQVRILLEPWAFSETIRLHSTDHIERARDSLKQAMSHLDSPEALPELIAANRRFHRYLYSGCGNEIVVSRLDEMQDLTALGIATVLWDHRPTWKQECKEHEQILAAVEAGNTATVEDLAKAHIQASLTELSVMAVTDGNYGSGKAAGGR